LYFVVEMKKCPFCTGEIQDAAAVCKHCNREIGTQPAGNSRRLQIAYSPAIYANVSPRNVIAVVVVAAILGWFWLVR
jgi:hypothetical protein